MNISIRQAHKIVTKIVTRLASISTSPNAEVTIWREHPSEAMIEAFQSFSDAIARTIALNTVRQSLRDAIGAANGIEIDQLISKRKNLLDTITMYRSIVAANSTYYVTPEEVVMQINALKAQAGSTPSYSRSDTIRVCVLNKVLVDTMVNMIDQLQLSIEEVEENLTTANSSSTNKIQLSAESLKVLQSEFIIAQQ